MKLNFNQQVKLTDFSVKNEKHLRSFEYHNFYWYFSAVGWIVPAIFVIIAAVIDRLDIPDIPDEYKPG